MGWAEEDGYPVFILKGTGSCSCSQVISYLGEGENIPTAGATAPSESSFLQQVATMIER